MLSIVVVAAGVMVAIVAVGACDAARFLLYVGAGDAGYCYALLLLVPLGTDAAVAVSRLVAALAS